MPSLPRRRFVEPGHDWTHLPPPRGSASGARPRPAHGRAGAADRHHHTATIEDLNRAFDAGTLTAERLVRRYLDRIAAYDDAGPVLNAVITLNARALDRARALDAERVADGPRSPLHGIPVVLKDNLDTADMPTTAGSVLLQGSLPPDDAFLVRKLRAAGAIVLAKVNMSEFASGGALSSLGGRTRNPHDLTRSPSGSSGGTGAAIAAAYAQVGLGTDTGGSVRGPSTANGIAGLKPTYGLLSRDGIVPLALSFDTRPGRWPATSTTSRAALGVMTGVDPADEATARRHRPVRDRLHAVPGLRMRCRGARIGVARDFLGQDTEVDWIVEASLDVLRDAGATVVDVRFPEWLLDAPGHFYAPIRYREFRAQIADYLATLEPGFPTTLAGLIEDAGARQRLRGRRCPAQSRTLAPDARGGGERPALGSGVPRRAHARPAARARRDRGDHGRRGARGHRLPDLAPAARPGRHRAGAVRGAAGARPPATRT